MKQFVVHKTNFTKKGLLKGNKNWLVWSDLLHERLARRRFQMHYGTVSGTLSRLIRKLKQRPEQRRFWATHFNRKWGHLHFKAHWRYQICIFKCLYYYRDDLFKNLGKATIQKWKTTTSGWRAYVAQKCLCLSSLFIDYYEVAQETGANNRPPKLFHGAITHKTAKWPRHTHYYTFPICNCIQRTCVVG